MSKSKKIKKRNQRQCVVAKAENLEYMSTLKSETFQLIYLDPPFNTSKIQKSKKFKKKKWPEKIIQLEYYDSFGDGIQGYLEFMRPRLRHCYRLLKETGVLCVHLDLNSSHYVKVMLDEIFGIDNFINEIIWTYNRWTTKSRCFQKIHDTILVYSKGDNYKFKTPMKDHSFSSLKEYKFLKKPNGEIVSLTKEQLLGCEKIPKGDRFRTLRRKDTKGKNKDKQYLKDYPKVRAGSVLKIPSAGKSERVDNYPTQKPLKLINIFVETFTEKNDLVGDFFCGCGTTMEVALRSGRRFNGCDGQSNAIQAINERILKRGLNKDSIETTAPFDKTPKDFKKMNHRDFERRCVLLVEGVPNSKDKQSCDGGIDGIRIKDGAIIQVKQSKNIGEPKIRELLGAMTAKRTRKGVFVAYSFNNNAKNLACELRKHGYEIELKTVSQLKKELEVREKERKHSA